MVIMTMESTFLFEGGSLALDFLNTRRLRRGRILDGLGTPQGLQAWIREAGQSSARNVPVTTSLPAARELLSEATRLRDEIHRALEARRSGASLPASSLHTINRVLDASRLGLTLRLGQHGPELVEHERGSELRTLLAPVAVSAAELLTTANPTRIRQCDAEACALWFLDTSKNGRRRWCSMARCGNRAKAKKHWEKQQLEPFE
jgi:predicted RNA-binding Zn ribbon-like protein